MKKENKKNDVKKNIEKNKILIGLIVILILSILALLSINKEGKTKITAKSTLAKILEIEELSTIEHIYNAVATKYDNKKNVEYYVAYESKVIAGIKPNEIKTEIKNNKIIIKIPDGYIQDYVIDYGKLDYIFIEKQKESNAVSQEAYKLAQKDLEERLKKNHNIKKSAKENAKIVIQGFLKSWIDTLDEKYEIVIE